MDQYVGKLLDDRYEILERIGSGGMAVVYKGRDHRLNRFVAVKILKEDLAQDEEFRRRFHDESHAVAMLSHPNIMAVYDVSQSTELDYIVMELIEGITLKQYMQKRGGKLTWKESLHFISQIMKALSHAHSRGIIHRDIKPHNIMILRDGSVKVADFGIARLMSSAQNTMTQEALGSVHYISPEQARGSRIDARSDIYSAGVVLYEMLTGRLPYEGDSPVAVAIQHINSIPLSPREIDPSIPEALEAITNKAMASKLEKRYVSADAMLADLEEFRKNPNISFDYTAEDLQGEENDEPTQVLGANTPQTVAARPAHSERYEESGGKARRERRERRERQEEEEDYDDNEGSGKRFVVVVLAVAVCLVGIGVFLWNTVFSGLSQTKTYPVPNVAGLTLEEARSLPEVIEGGFTLEEGLYSPSETVDKDRIISQSPEAKAEVKAEERTITVEISTGTGDKLMPRLYNMEQRVAENVLNQLGLSLDIQYEQENSSEITKNNVISQTPEEKTPLVEGQQVTLVISLGPDVKQVPMIAVTGMELSEATRILTEKLKLRMGSVEPVPSEEYPKGQVCYQSTPPNTSVPEGTVINLKVSTGPEETVASQSPVPSEPTVSAEPSTEPTPSAEPSAQPTRRKELLVDLPSDRDTVTVRITVGGVEQINQTESTRMRMVRYNLEGSGQQEVVVYIDNIQSKTLTMDFSN